MVALFSLPLTFLTLLTPSNLNYFPFFTFDGVIVRNFFRVLWICCFLPHFCSCNAHYLGRCRHAWRYWHNEVIALRPIIQDQKESLGNSTYPSRNPGNKPIKHRIPLLPTYQTYFSHYCFNSWHELDFDLFIYILGQLRMYGTNLFFYKRSIVIPTHYSVHHVFFHRLWLPTLCCSTPIPTWSILSNVYR